MQNNITHFYRNKTDCVSIEGIDVDAGSLWKLSENNLLILEDDDQYCTHILTENFSQLS